MEDLLLVYDYMGTEQNISFLVKCFGDSSSSEGARKEKVME